MLRWTPALALFSLLLHAAPLHAADRTGASSRDGWPATRAGDMGRRWVAAFDTGDSAMREFNLKELAPPALAKTSMPARIERYRDLRERFGRLTFASVVESSPHRATVRLLASDASVHVFIFTVQDKPPYRLLSVGMREPGFGHGFGHH